MKNYTKVGNRQGRPAYRTSSVFRYKKYVSVVQIKSVGVLGNRTRGKKR
ncbi:MAG TPA: hypothetical protein VJH94_03225 [Candidatus Paceibacterota bacterium]